MSSRNLGATAATFEGHGEGLTTNPGCLQYSFGRVTPFASTLGSPMDNIEEESQNFAYAVKNPLTFVVTAASTSSTWTEQDTSANYMWHDKNVGANTDGKSIFDPSPIGWRIPIQGVWSDFSANCTAVSDNIATYTPASAVIPALGHRDRTSSVLSQLGIRVYQWSSTPSSATNGSIQYVTTGNATTSTWNRASAIALRSIRE